MGKKYAAHHLGDFSDEELKKAKDRSEREESKDQQQIFFLYSYLILSCVFSLRETSLRGMVYVQFDRDHAALSHSR